MAHAKIYLSPSDQTANKYAYGGTTEAVVCRKISDACEVALVRCGFAVKNNKTSSMSARVSESNKWGADLHVAIHTNAYNKKVTGTRIFCWNKTGAGYKASKAVYNVLAPLTPGTSENISTNKTLYEIRVPYAPSVYIEVDFHDVADVAKWLINNTTEIGETIAKGICNYYGKSYVKPAPPAAEDGIVHVVQVGVYEVEANAKAMVDKLKKAGFPGIIVKTKK